jgi:hypothetical protein
MLRSGGHEEAGILSKRVQCLDAFERSRGSERVVVRRVVLERELLGEFRSESSTNKHTRKRVEEKPHDSRFVTRHYIISTAVMNFVYGYWDIGKDFTFTFLTRPDFCGFPEREFFNSHPCSRQLSEYAQIPIRTLTRNITGIVRSW